MERAAREDKPGEGKFEGNREMIELFGAAVHKLALWGDESRLRRREQKKMLCRKFAAMKKVIKSNILGEAIRASCS